MLRTKEKNFFFKEQEEYECNMKILNILINEVPSEIFTPIQIARNERCLKIKTNNTTCLQDG